ncbi:MAG: hypothetical protein JOY61_10690 [Chloroflexi bacterium]|nr:hypothetical protein [Chloroflexota bacterium]
MPNYVLIYKGGAMGQSEAERNQIMAAWGQWFGSLGQDVVDGGNPFGPSRSIGANGSVGGGATSGLTGYSILKASNLDEATEKARGCPVLKGGGSVEVYETFNAM